MLSDWPPGLVELVAVRLALLAEPTRVRLLAALEQGEGTVRELADRVDSSAQNVSHHLCILHRAGIVARRRAGTCAYYTLADYSACRLLDEALESLAGQIDELSDLVRIER